MIEEITQQIPPKIYIQGEVGKGAWIMKKLTYLGGKNKNFLGGNNPYRYYYINQNWIICWVDINSDEGYILKNSDWEEITNLSLKKM